MFALCLGVVATYADPVMVAQLRYPANRITVTTASGYNVYYIVPRDTPPELYRAYKLLEVAEREVLITEALQLFRAEMVANERKLEALKTARHASYLDQSQSPFKTLTQESSNETGQTSGVNWSRSSQALIYVDPSLSMLVPESTFKMALGAGMAYDARVERAIAAIERMAEAQYQLRQALVNLAYPDAANRPIVKKPGKIEVTRADAGSAPAVAKPAPNRAARPALTPPSALDEAIRAERVAAAAEVLAEDRERQARAALKAADEANRAAAPGDRVRARDAWASAREEWELAKRDWEDARESWLSAKRQLEAARGTTSTTFTTSPSSAITNPPVTAPVTMPVDGGDPDPVPNAYRSPSRPATQPAPRIVMNPSASTAMPRISTTTVPRTTGTTPAPTGITPAASRVTHPAPSNKAHVTHKK